MSVTGRTALPHSKAGKPTLRLGTQGATSDEAFDDLALLATRLSGAPIGAVTVVDADRHWFRSIVGIDGEIQPSEFEFCAAQPAHSDDLVIVSDVLADTRFEATDDLLLLHGIRFYAGIRLTDSEGRYVGSLSIMDRLPRALGEIEVEGLRALARQAVRLIEADRATTSLSEQVAELSSAKDRAELSDRSKSAFLANISEEIRTPMNGVLGIASLLKDTPLDGRQSKYVETIERSAGALMGVLANVLEFATLDSRTVSLQHRPMRPSDAARAAIAGAAESAKAKGLEILSSFGPASESLRNGDCPRIQRVLEHLINNAVKFTQAGSMCVSIDLVGREEAGIFRFSVADTGIGIEPENIACIFDLFQNADSCLAKRFGSTGLGLVLCRQLVHLMGGRLSVKSEPGLGSTFFFEIPMGPDMGAHASACQDQAADLAGRKVLVADDNKVNAMVISSMLIRHGCQVTCVADGRQALSALVTEQFDCVLMELQIPEMDGLQATRAIRRLGGARSRTPIVAITAESQPIEREACLQAGMNALISKPIREAVVLDAVRGLLRHGDRQDERIDESRSISSSATVV